MSQKTKLRGYVRRFLRMGPSPVSVILASAVLVVFGLTQYIDAHRIDPSLVSQETYRAIGTESGSRRYEQLPRLRRVSVQAPDESTLRIVAGYLPAPVGKGGTQVAAGKFDPNTETIYILDDAAALQASLPRDMRKKGAWIFRRVLRHEYGHAFLEDWLRDTRASESEYDECQTCGRDEAAESGFPPALQPLAAEWLAGGRDLYCEPYLTSTFSEYFAESYARTLTGAEVPPQTSEFFAAWSSRTD